MRTLHLGDIDPVDAAGVHWLPLRRELGVTAFGTNAYHADAGELLIEPHDEAGTTDEELYVVVTGRATFTVAGQEVDAGPGTVVFCPDPAEHRTAVATADGTLALAVGNPAGAAGPLPAWQYRFAAVPAEEAGDFVAAYATAAGALEDHPDDAWTHYALAGYAAQGGQRERALEHWRRAVAAAPGARDEAAGDPLLDPIRGALERP